MITRHAPREILPRHRHAQAYVAVVLAGDYVEAGDSGRWHARAGTVMVHGAYEAHRDAFAERETVVLNLPLVAGMTPSAGSVADIDAIARAAERSSLAAAELVAAAFRPTPALDDWPDLLARALADDPALSLARWADCMGLAPASVSRGFERAYGVSPKRFRLEARARRALRGITTTAAPLAQVAAGCGFADQAHMTRALVALTGAPPGAMRAKSVQADGATRG